MTLQSQTDAMEQQLTARYGIDATTIQTLKELESAAPAFGGTIDQDFSIKIKNGKGSETSPSKTTFWVTIDGTAEITAPQEGTWDVTVEDLVANKTVCSKSGWKAHEPITCRYKTGWSAQLKITAIWSEKKDTTLTIHIKATY